MSERPSAVDPPSHNMADPATRIARPAMSASMVPTPTRGSCGEAAWRIFHDSHSGFPGAQTPVAPTNESPVGPKRGQEISDYIIVRIRSSWDIGSRRRWKWIPSTGATVNFGNGIRLLDELAGVRQFEGHGGDFRFDSYSPPRAWETIRTSAIFEVEKNRIYRYDLLWRSIAYFNPGLTVANGRHYMDTLRRLQDHDLTLFPQSNFRLFMGYSRSAQSGPALTTIQLFDANGDEYPLFANVRREQNEYRLGGEVKLFGIRLNVMKGWSDFKEDTPVSLEKPSEGSNPNDFNSLASLRRAEPYHGTSPYWRGALFTEGKKYWAANGRITYVAGKRAFVLDEVSSGTNRTGAGFARQVLTSGNAQRPALAGNFTFSVFPLESLTLTNQTSVSSLRMVGNSYYTVYNNGFAGPATLPFQFLGIRSISNSTSAQFRVRPWLQIHGEYGYDSRRIRSIEGLDIAGFPPTPAVDRAPIEQTNQLHSALAGFRIKPVKPLTLLLDAEIGRADRPIYPISERNYRALRSRVEYKAKALRLAAFARNDYNTNSTSLTSFASHSRQYGADGSWLASSWFSIDAAYSKLHLDTLGGTAYFVSRQNVTSATQYVSNIHSASLAARFDFRGRADVAVGFSHTLDSGAGIDLNRVVPVVSPTPPTATVLQTFPLMFSSPMAKLSVRISEKIRWNAGYQYYAYKEDFANRQNYRANTGYTSILWAF